MVTTSSSAELVDAAERFGRKLLLADLATVAAREGFASQSQSSTATVIEAIKAIQDDLKDVRSEIAALRTEFAAFRAEANPGVFGNHVDGLKVDTAQAQTDKTEIADSGAELQTDIDTASSEYLGLENNITL